MDDATGIDFCKNWKMDKLRRYLVSDPTISSGIRSWSALTDVSLVLMHKKDRGYHNIRDLQALLANIVNVVTLDLRLWELGEDPRFYEVFPGFRLKKLRYFTVACDRPTVLDFLMSDSKMPNLETLEIIMLKSDSYPHEDWMAPAIAQSRHTLRALTIRMDLDMFLEHHISIPNTESLDLTPVLLCFPSLSTLRLECDYLKPSFDSLASRTDVCLQSLENITLIYVPGIAYDFVGLKEILAKRVDGLADFHLEVKTLVWDSYRYLSHVFPAKNLKVSRCKARICYSP